MYVHMSFRLQTNVYVGKSEGRINIRSMTVQNKNICGMTHGIS
jgi:hypothetical protein